MDASGWTDDWSALFYVFVALYVWLTYYPLPSIFLVAVTSQYMTGEWSAPLTALFCAAVCHIMLGYVADIVLDAMDTLFLCFAIQRDNNIVGSTDGRKAVYILLTEMPGTMGAKGGRGVVHGGVAHGVHVATALPVQYV